MKEIDVDCQFSVLEGTLYRYYRFFFYSTSSSGSPKRVAIIHYFYDERSASALVVLLLIYNSLKNAYSIPIWEQLSAKLPFEIQIEQFVCIHLSGLSLHD